jgi:hypothetical protein
VNGTCTRIVYSTVAKRNVVLASAISFSLQIKLAILGTSGFQRGASANDITLQFHSSVGSNSGLGRIQARYWSLWKRESLGCLLSM